MMDTISSNGPCVAEECQQNDSQEDAVGIRSIMVQQETLFKEQVQALHRLYKVQKLEMRELEKRKNHLNLETAELTNGFSSVSGLDEKSGELVRPVARVYKRETGSLALHPFCSLKLFEGSGSVSFGGSFQRPEGSLSKQVNDFDLESFPQGWVDESVIVIQPDDSSQPTKASENASFEDYKSDKSNETSEDGLLTTSSGKVVTRVTEGNHDSIPADMMDRKTKLSHQGSFASVNGCLYSSSSEGEENNSKIAATLEMTEPKMEQSQKGQAPLSFPQCLSSVAHSEFALGSADRHRWTLKTSSKGIEEHASDIPDGEGLQSSELICRTAHLISSEKSNAATSFNENKEDKYSQVSTAAGTLAGREPTKGVQQLQRKVEAKVTDFYPSSNESSNPSKRKHHNNTMVAEAASDKLMKCSKSAKMFPSRSTP